MRSQMRRTLFRTCLRMAAVAGVTCAGTEGASAHTPPAPGNEPPPYVAEFFRQNPVDFDTPGAWREKVQRVRAARAAHEAGGFGDVDEQGAGGAQFAVTGVLRVPVILFGYSNVVAPAVTINNLQQELFTGPWAPMTLTQYYNEISYGNVTVTGNVFHVGGLPQTDLFYSGNTHGLGAGAQLASLIQDAVQAADATVNFGQYDNDGPDGVPNSGDDDGVVDFIALVQPGIGGECWGSPGTNIWSHRWSYSSASGGGVLSTNDAAAGGGFIRVNDYTIQPSLSCGGGLIEIGVFCHEFGHAFGLPDVYDTDGTAAGVGDWCLMGTGSWNSPTSPAHMSAWCKAELGWLNVQLVYAPNVSVVIPPVETMPTVFKLYNEVGAREYFLLENRQPLGADVHLRNAGLAIWHVDATRTHNRFENCGGIVQVTGANPLLALEQADGLCNLEANANRGDAGDIFPGTSGTTSFTPSTFPNSRNYCGLNTGVSVTNIVQTGQNVACTIDGLPLPAAALPAIDVMFLIDNSGSMGDDQPNISAQITGIVNDIRTAFPVNSRFGLSTFRDFPYAGFGSTGDWAYRLEQALTSNTATFIANVQALGAGGGADWPESQYEALYQVLTGSGLDLDGSGTYGNVPGEISPMPVNWGSNTVRVVYVLTDAEFHNPDVEPTYPSPLYNFRCHGRTAVLGLLPGPCSTTGPIVYILNIDHEGPYVNSGENPGTPPPPPDNTLLEYQSEEIAALSGSDVLYVGNNSIGLQAAIRTSLEQLTERFQGTGACVVEGYGVVTGVTQRDCQDTYGGEYVFADPNDPNLPDIRGGCCIPGVDCIQGLTYHECTFAFGGIYLGQPDPHDPNPCADCFDDTDCNLNGQRDWLDIRYGFSFDNNGDGVPDECETGCPADVNGDGIVNLGDLAIVLGNFGAGGVGHEGGDIDGDGQVTLSDLAVVLADFGSFCE